MTEDTRPLGEIHIRITRRCENGIETAIQIKNCTAMEMLIIGKELVSEAEKKMAKTMMMGLLEMMMSKSEASFSTETPLTHEQLQEVLRNVAKREEEE